MKNPEHRLRTDKLIQFRNTSSFCTFIQNGNRTIARRKNPNIKLMVTHPSISKKAWINNGKGISILRSKICFLDFGVVYCFLLQYGHFMLVVKTKELFKVCFHVHPVLQFSHIGKFLPSNYY